MGKVCRFFFVVFFTLFNGIASPLYAAHKAVLKNQTVPEMLYHWISIDSINKPKKVAYVENGFLPLPKLYPSFKLVDAIPKLAYSKGLFVWSHPIGGVGTGPEEIYGDLGALIAIKTENRSHRVLAIETDNRSGPLDINVDLRSVELLHHKHFIVHEGKRHLAFEEWVITKPYVGENFTADPAVIKDIISKEISFMKKGGKYDASDLHAKIPPGTRYQEPFANSKYARETYILPRLMRYLDRDETEFHESWRRPLDLCERAELRYGS